MRPLVEEGLAQSAEACGRRHQAADTNHEVRISLEEGKLAVESAEVILKERGVLLVVAERSKLSKPDWLVSTDAVNFVEMVDQGLRIAGRRVPVGNAEVNLAADTIAGAHEALEPPSTLAIKVAVAYGRRADASTATIGVDVLDMGGGGGLGRKVGLRGDIRLVETQDVGGTLAETLLNVVRPSVSMVSAVAPEHGNELDAAGKAVANGVPVVGPRTPGSAVDKVVDKVSVIIGEATLAARGGAGSGIVDSLDVDRCALVRFDGGRGLGGSNHLGSESSGFGSDVVGGLTTILVDGLLGRRRLQGDGLSLINRYPRGRSRGLLGAAPLVPSANVSGRDGAAQGKDGGGDNRNAVGRMHFKSRLLL